MSKTKLLTPQQIDTILAIFRNYRPSIVVREEFKGQLSKLTGEASDNDLVERLEKLVKRWEEYQTKAIYYKDTSQVVAIQDMWEMVRHTYHSCLEDVESLISEAEADEEER